MWKKLLTKKELRVNETGSGLEVETSSRTCSCSPGGASGLMFSRGHRVRSTEEKVKLRGGKMKVFFSEVLVVETGHRSKFI